MISLSKGQGISLKKADGSDLTKVFMGLGWDKAKAKGGFLGRMFGGGDGDNIDLDASVGLFDASGRRVDVVYFRNLASKDGSVSHSGDNLTGDGDGDDEVIKVDLTRVPANVQTLVFVVTSFRGQQFTEVDNATCRLVDDTNGKETARYNLTGGQPVTGMVMAKLAREGSGWKMTAIGEPGNGRTVEDLSDLIKRFL